MIVLVNGRVRGPVPPGTPIEEADSWRVQVVEEQPPPPLVAAPWLPYTSDNQGLGECDMLEVLKLES